jgi:hypothetical protein
LSTTARSTIPARAIGGLGSSFTGFDSVAVDVSAVWLLSGTNALDSGTTLTDFGTLEIVGSIVNGGVVDIETGGRLILDNGATGAGGIAFVSAERGDTLCQSRLYRGPGQHRRDCHHSRATTGRELYRGHQFH